MENRTDYMDNGNLNQHWVYLATGKFQLSPLHDGMQYSLLAWHLLHLLVLLFLFFFIYSFYIFFAVNILKKDLLVVLNTKNT